MFLKNSQLCLYGMHKFYLIFGHFRQFLIFNLWVRPLWFSTLHMIMCACVVSIIMLPTLPQATIKDVHLLGDIHKAIMSDLRECRGGCVCVTEVTEDVCD